jgi:hypothetical protein
MPVSLWLLHAVVVAQPPAADSLRMRFVAADGLALHRVFQTHTRLTVTGSDGAVRVRETADLGSMRQITLLDAEARPVLHLAFDSLKTRMREGAEPWREVAVGGLDSLWVQVQVDDRLRVIDRRTEGAHAALGMLAELATGVPEFTLPERTVKAGSRWTSHTRFPVGAYLARQRTGMVLAAVDVRVDSVVARARDTLAFLSLDGSLRPAPGGSGSAPLAYRGSLAGTLVWSTGWNAIVAQATRVRLELEGGAPAGSRDAASPRAVMETTVRAQVRAGK